MQLRSLSDRLNVRRNLWKLAAALMTVTVGVIGGWWGTHFSHTHTAVFGGLRIIEGDAQTVSGSITEQQALSIVEAKLASLDPNVDWKVDLGVASAAEFPQLTQVVDAKGVVRYRRNAPIDAWVVQVTVNGARGLGVVSNNVAGTVSCGAGVCDPPGTLLNAQVQTPPTAQPCTTVQSVRVCPP
jgi:hypothetical protein